MTLAASSFEPQEDPRRARKRRRILTLGGLTLAAALAFLAQWIRPRPALAVFGRVPSFHLVDEQGAPFGSSEMLGHVSVVDFIFTRCPSSCPRLTATMHDLQSRLVSQRSAAKLVSFSVDPENDTPAVLRDYADRAHADLARWSFLTGPPDAITQTVVSGFKVSAAKVARGAADYDVIHGDWIVLVDSRQQIRGYYSTERPGELDALVSDVRRLERER